VCTSTKRDGAGNGVARLGGAAQLATPCTRPAGCHPATKIVWSRCPMHRPSANVHEEHSTPGPPVDRCCSGPCMTLLQALEHSLAERALPSTKSLRSAFSREHTPGAISRPSMSVQRQCAQARQLQRVQFPPCVNEDPSPQSVAQPIGWSRASPSHLEAQSGARTARPMPSRVVPQR